MSTDFATAEKGKLQDAIYFVIVLLDSFEFPDLLSPVWCPCPHNCQYFHLPRSKVWHEHHYWEDKNDWWVYFQYFGWHESRTLQTAEYITDYLLLPYLYHQMTYNGYCQTFSYKKFFQSFLNKPNKQVPCKKKRVKISRS